MTAKRKKKPRTPRRPGLPATESVVEEKVYVSPKGGTYRILRTNEVDEYEEGSRNVAESQSRKGRRKKPL